MPNTLSILGFALLCVTLLIGPRLLCGENLEPIASPTATQQAILRQFVSGPANCIYEEIWVRYSVKIDGHLVYHIAHYNPGPKMLQIETDPGSGWSFGWENVDTPLIERVLREGSDFRLFTKYCPTSMHLPGRNRLPY